MNGLIKFEEEALNSELPMNWFIGYDYGTGVCDTGWDFTIKWLS